MAQYRRLGHTNNPAGRPEMVPTPEQRSLVVVLAGLKVPQKMIAEKLGLADVRTLNRHFAAEIEDGRENLIASLKAQLVGAAMRGSVRAQTWLLERLEPEQFAPRYRRPEDEMPLVPLTDADEVRPSHVEIYLPDNARSSGDVSPVTHFVAPPLIDAEKDGGA